jgi:hypothetical protein
MSASEMQNVAKVTVLSTAFGCCLEKTSNGGMPTVNEKPLTVFVASIND